MQKSLMNKLHVAQSIVVAFVMFALAFVMIAVVLSLDSGAARTPEKEFDDSQNSHFRNTLRQNRIGAMTIELFLYFLRNPAQTAFDENY